MGRSAVLVALVLAVACSADLQPASSARLRDLLLGPLQGERYSIHGRERTRAILRREFQQLGLDVWFHNFTATELVDQGRLDGVNVVARIPGTLASPKILLFGAHYDTVEESNGVNDNGSGVSAILELARIFVNSQCSFNHSVFFVAFDLEEVGCLGSYHLLGDFFTEEMKTNFLGAYILDTVLNYNSTDKSQDLPEDFRKALPEVMQTIEDEGSKGDFLSLIAREEEDRHLAQALETTWGQHVGPSKLHTMAIPLGAGTPDTNDLMKHFNFLRSDHAIFWFHNPKSLRAVLITDMGPFRGVMRSCYHRPCDDGRMVTSDNLRQLAKLTDSVAEAALDLAEGSCTLDMAVAASMESSGQANVPGCLMSTLLLALMLVFWS